MNGPEPAAIVANPSFSAANVWNNLQNPYAPPLTKNPSWSHLVDSTGATTNVNLSITGTVLPIDLYPWTTNPDPLRVAFMGWNSWTKGGGGGGAGETTFITWKLTGLPPRTTFDLCFYGSNADIDRGFNMTIQNITMNVPTFISTNSPRPNCVLFSKITSDATGTITGRGAGVGSSLTAANEANWSGFQLVQTLPSTGARRLGFWRQ